MSALDIFAEMIKTYQVIKENVDDDTSGTSLPKAPEAPKLVENQFVGAQVREFISSVRSWVSAINTNKVIQAETRGLSGTKNEMLRDQVIRMNDLMTLMIDHFDDYVDALIEKKFSHEEVTQQEINKITNAGPIVVSGEVDKVALFKLRKFTKSKPDANYYEYIRSQKSMLFSDTTMKLSIALDRYFLVPKSTKSIEELWPECKSANDLITLFNPVTYDKNVLIIKRDAPGYIFGTVNPKQDDVMKPIDVDFIRRTRVVNSVTDNATERQGHIVCLPRPGALVGVYETYNYETFQFMSLGLDKNLVPYSQALGYFTANTGIVFDDTPVACHVGYNDSANKTFADNFYRHDLVLMASEFKFGQGLADSIKQKIKELLLEDAENYKTLDVKALILRAVNAVIPEDISRESAISSYLGLIRLSDEFLKEYKHAIKDVHWETHKRLAMVDVFNRCSAKCDKLNAWSIDFKSPKDLFWK